MEISQNQSHSIAQANAWDVVAGMPGDAVDHIISDPPYSEKTHAGARQGGIDTPLIDYDSIAVVDLLALTSEYLRVAKFWVVMTVDYMHAAYLQMEFPEQFVRMGVWIKPNAAPQFSGDRPGQGWEAVAILNSRRRALAWNGGGRHAVWTYPVQPRAEVKGQKPLPLVKAFVVDFTNPGQTIFDPMMGAGTTGVAAIELSRRFIGCDIRPDAYAVADRRISIAAQQLVLPMVVE